jgi:uncharacterized membrane protein
MGVVIRDELQRWSIPLRCFAVCIAFSIFGTILSKITGLNPGSIPMYASILTMLSGVLTLHRSLGSINALVWTLLLGASAELIGLNTGFPFGRYRYTDAWKPTIELSQFFFFPVLLPLAWFLIVGASWLTFSHLKGWMSILMTGVLATIIDFGMEEVMVRRLKYWFWLDESRLPGGAPWLNSVGWFVVSVWAATILRRRCAEKIDESTNEGPLVLSLYLCLMLALWIF